MNKLNLDDLPFLKDYRKLKSWLSIRLTNSNHLKPDTIFKPFLDLSITCHIDIGDVVASVASCTVNSGLLEYIGVEKERLFSDALENSIKTRPPVTMPIETCLTHLGFPGVEEGTHLMVATTEGLAYGAAVVLYPAFLERVSCGRSLFFIPSSVHEWIYLEDDGTLDEQELTDLLQTVNREIVAEEEILSDHLYCWRDGRFGKAE